MRTLAERFWDAATQDNVYRLEQIEKLRTAPIRASKQEWVRCYICGELMNGEAGRYTRLPFIGHLHCVEEHPIYRPPVKAQLAEDGTLTVIEKQTRAQGVEDWVRQFHQQVGCELTHFTVHNVRDWIAENDGPDFSYAGVRRICKQLFAVEGRGSFKSREKLPSKVTQKRGRRKGSAKATRNYDIKTGRRKWGTGKNAGKGKKKK